MAKRIVLAGLLGGLALFLCETVAHMVLPLGEAGVKALPDEPAMAAAFKANIKEAGFYIFPMPDQSPGMTREQQQAAMQKAMEKMRAGPTGIMVIYPQGREVLLPSHLATQFGSDVLSMLLAAALLSWAIRLKTYGSRVLFVMLLGLLPALAVDVPQWNWYGFPAVYTLAQLVVHLAGFLAGGLLVARLSRAGAAA
jgi:hypothetical protein